MWVDERVVDRIGAAQPDLAPRFRPQKGGIEQNAVAGRGVLPAVAVDARHDMELHVRPSVVICVEEAADLDDVGGEYALAEQQPLQRMTMRLRPWFSTNMLIGSFVRAVTNTSRWSCIFLPTPGRSMATGTSIACRCPPGPMPESIKTFGVISAPAASTMPLRALTIVSAPPRPTRTPKARPLSMTMRDTGDWTRTSNLPLERTRDR